MRTDAAKSAAISIPATLAPLMAAHNDAVNMAHLPIHDLCAAIGPALHMGAWGLAPERERTMRAALGAFVDEAIAGLV